MKKEFKENDLVVFIGKNYNIDGSIDINNGGIYRVEVGKFKRYTEDKKKAFVYYHSGETAAGTDVNDLEPIENYRYLKTNLGNGDEYL